MLLLLSQWFGFLSESSLASSSSSERHLQNSTTTPNNQDDDDDDDDDNLWSRHHDYNQTVITTTVSIRVTPRNDFLLSWACLSLLLLLAIAWATWQVYKERKIDQTAVTSSSTTSSSAAARSAAAAAVGSSNRGHGSLESTPTSSDRLVESASTAEVTRCVVSQ